jgi:hypothetical protein
MHRPKLMLELREQIQLERDEVFRLAFHHSSHVRCI